MGNQRKHFVDAFEQTVKNYLKYISNDFCNSFNNLIFYFNELCK